MNNIKRLNSQVEFHKKYLNDFLESNEDETKITVLENTEAFYSDEGTCDTKYCDENNIPYSRNEMFNNVGCIVSIKGNIIVDIKRKFDGGECFCDNFSKALCEYFRSKGINSVRQDNNDVLVDGYKVASGAEVDLPNGFRYAGYQISINQDLDTIKRVCKKPMVKVPKALSEYGITTDEMKDFCVYYWTNN